MKSICLDYRETGAFSPALLRYLEGDPALTSFYAFSPDFSGAEQRLATRRSPANRQVLATVLHEQYDRLSDATAIVPEAVLTNIAALANENTFTITTGHQLNIFTGPLFFIYKIASAIKLASDLAERFPGKTFVPVYWMATEDHDFAEINHTSVGGEPVSWNKDASGATGRLSLEGFEEVLKKMNGLLGSSPNAERLAELFRQAYDGQKNLADATRALANGLFGSYGLVCVDADDARLKSLFVPIMERDILEQNSFREINRSSEALKQAGFDTQVNAREINFFYLKDHLRERIVAENDYFQVLNADIRWTAEELKQEINDHPERFSPNVVMRPLYQEVILPNLGYIGGGAEMVYWLQLKATFDYYGVDFPLLILRNSALIADEADVRKLSRWQLSLTDLFEDPLTLQKNWVKAHSSHDLSLDAERSEVAAIFDQLRTRAELIDKTLGPSTAAVQARLEKAFASLEKKLIKADQKNHTTALSQLSKIHSDLFPGGKLQERSQNFAPFFVRYGDAFIRDLIEQFQPLDFKFTIFY